MPWTVEDIFIVVLGGNTFVNAPDLIVYRGASVFKIERHVDSGYLGVSFKIYDETGMKLATVGHNVLFENKKYKGTKTIALEGSVHDYIVREQPSDRIVCNIKRKEAAKPAELDVSVSLYMPDGFLFEANPDSINLPIGKEFINCKFTGVGIRIYCPDEPIQRMRGGMSVPAMEEFCKKPFSYS